MTRRDPHHGNVSSSMSVQDLKIGHRGLAIGRPFYFHSKNVRPMNAPTNAHDLHTQQRVAKIPAFVGETRTSTPENPSSERQGEGRFFSGLRCRASTWGAMLPFSIADKLTAWGLRPSSQGSLSTIRELLAQLVLPICSGLRLQEVESESKGK